MHKNDYNNKIIEDACNILNNDGIIIIPTDTVYGLAASSKSSIAIKKIYDIKKRAQDKKLPIIVDTKERLMHLCEITKNQLEKLHPYYPGKLTLVLRKKDSEETLAIRMINNELINKIIDKLDCPLMLTSANLSNKETSDNILDILDDFEGKVDMIIVGNKVNKTSSTIIQLIDNKISLIREGAIPFKEIEEAFYRG